MTAACGGRDPILIDRLGYARPLQDELVTIPHALVPESRWNIARRGPGPPADTVVCPIPSPRKRPANANGVRHAFSSEPDSSYGDFYRNPTGPVAGRARHFRA
jgi:hypothetical protein